MHFKIKTSKQNEKNPAAIVSLCKEVSMTFPEPHLKPHHSLCSLMSETRPTLVIFASNKVRDSCWSLCLDIFLHPPKSSSLCKVKCHFLLTCGLIPFLCLQPLVPVSVGLVTGCFVSVLIVPRLSLSLV